MYINFVKIIINVHLTDIRPFSIELLFIPRFVRETKGTCKLNSARISVPIELLQCHTLSYPVIHCHTLSYTVIPCMYICWVSLFTHTHTHSYTLTLTGNECEVLSLAEVMYFLCTSTKPVIELNPSDLFAKPPGFLLFSPNKVPSL